MKNKPPTVMLELPLMLSVDWRPPVELSLEPVVDRGSRVIDIDSHQPQTMRDLVAFPRG